jgi:DNA-binding PadR family transcriptional regulator
MNLEGREADVARKSLSLGTVMVLHALARGKAYGFDIIEETGLSSGTIYPALDRLERLGFARSKWEDARVARREKRPPRRYYRITPAGAGELQEALERHRSLARLDLSPHLGDEAG